MGCGRSRPKSDLLRFVRVEGRVVSDPGGRAPGRGAYLCPEGQCAQLAERRGGFKRSFRAAVEGPQEREYTR
ncbi:MAG: uncharacterized protein QOG63_2445 [Thermoleophilaceae bacterium]|nr:uncharacterized protein [Thermoleophilaceae bacterium]